LLANQENKETCVEALEAKKQAGTGGRECRERILTLFKASSIENSTLTVTATEKLGITCPPVVSKVADRLDTNKSQFLDSPSA